MKGLDAKQPKLVATTVACLRDLVKSVPSICMYNGTEEG